MLSEGEGNESSYTEVASGAARLQLHSKTPGQEAGFSQTQPAELLQNESAAFSTPAKTVEEKARVAKMAEVA